MVMPYVPRNRALRCADDANPDFAEISLSRRPAKDAPCAAETAALHMVAQERDPPVLRTPLGVSKSVCFKTPPEPLVLPTRPV